MLLSLAPSTASAQVAPPAAVRGRPAALLLPVTGASSAVGLGMQRAALLAQSGGDEKAGFTLFDTGDSSEAAGGAAARAVGEGASAILGPLFARQVQAVAAAAGRTIPVISFSNSQAAPDSGVFTFGITPSQSVSAILQYARGRGVRRIAVIGDGSGWGEQCRRAAQRLSPEIGLQALDVAAASATVEALQSIGDGLPAAALLTGGAPQFASLGQSLQGAGVQVLGTMQALNGTSAGVPDGVWLSAPDPGGFKRFQAAFGSGAGLLSALAFDAARISATLARTGQLTREGLLAPAGFQALTGAVRFRPDGRCVRELAIVVLSAGSLKTVGRKAGL